MERRAVIAVVISIIILVLYQEVVIKRLYPPPPQSAEPESVEPPPAAPGEAPPPSEVAPAPPQPLPEVEATGGAEVVVDTELYRAVFTTLGARLKSLQLKHFRTAVDPNSPPLELVQYAVGNRLPLGVALIGKPSLTDSGVMYRADRQSLEISAGDS